MASLGTASLEEIRQAAARICGDYLNGRWKEVTADQLIVKRISGGLSNYLYYISLPQESSETQQAIGTATSSSSLLSSSATTTSSTAASSHDNDENRNEQHFNDLLTTGDCNGNKRKRYDSSSSSQTSLKLKEPNEVLLRIYGQAHGEDALEAMITESVVFALLSERHFGPRLHGIFPGGRIEQYIPARALLTAELANADISLKIAEKMAEIHTLKIPMSKEPDWLWNCMKRWQRLVPDILARTDWQDEQSNAAAKYMRDINYTEEVGWLKSVISRGNYPVMFCHNDLQEGNILIKLSDDGTNCTAEDSALGNISMQDDEANNLSTKSNRAIDLDSSGDSAISSANGSSNTPDLRIIDFEYCAYNFRGFDLANHFLEWTFNYSRSDFPFYYFNKENYPTTEQRHIFIKTYLKKLNDGKDDEWEPTAQEIEDVDQEVKLFRMLSHLFWSLWSLVNVNSNIEFGYWNYGIARINEFLKLKQQYITDNNLATV